MTSPPPASSYFWSLPHEDTPPLIVSVYQGPSIKGTVDASIAHMKELASQARSKGAQLILFPELFLRGYDLTDRAMKRSSINRAGPTMKRLQDVAASLRMALCFGYAEREADDGVEDFDGAVYNSAVCIDVDGSTVGYYRKCHLWQTEEKRRFTPGGDELLQSVFFLRDHPAHRFGMLICYDIEMPEPARMLILKGATVLLVMAGMADSGSDDLCPIVTVPARALENHCWILYSNLAGRREEGEEDDLDGPDPATIINFYGHSAVVGPDGRDLARAPRSLTRALLVAEIRPTPYHVLKFHSTPYLIDRRPLCYTGLETAQPSVPFKQMSTAEQAAALEKLDTSDDAMPKGSCIPLD